MPLTEMQFVFVVLAIAAALFVSGRVRLDVTAILVVLALAISGVLTPREALAGFGDPVVVLVAGLLVVGQALTRTGVAFSIGEWLQRVGGASETRMIVLLMLVSAGLGAFMSSTAVVAIFIPVVTAVAARTNLNAAHLFMPLSFGALISGMLTLIGTTPNLVVKAELEKAGIESLGFFTFTPVGVAVLAVAIVYMLLVGRRLLPGGSTEPPSTRARTFLELLQDFDLADRPMRVLVSARSPLVNRTLGEIDFGTNYGARVILLERAGRGAGRFVDAPGASTPIQTGDVLLMLGGREIAERLDAELGLTRLPVDARHRAEWATEIGLARILLHPESRLIGKTIREATFRSRYGLQALGIRHGTDVPDAYLDQRLAFGDTLLVAGPWRRILGLHAESRDFVVLDVPAEQATVAPARRKAPIAIAIMASMVALSAFDVLPVSIAVLLAALTVVLTRCLSMEDAYRGMPWSSIVLIAGMLPVAVALEKTGGVDFLVERLVGGIGAAGPYAMMSAIFAMTAGIGLFMSNTATAVLMTPLAIRAAEALDVAPLPFAITVVIAASTAFATPVASPVVTLVVEPGRYRFIDFLKVGGPMMILSWIVTIALVPLLYPL